MTKVISTYFLQGGASLTNTPGEIPFNMSYQDKVRNKSRTSFDSAPSGSLVDWITEGLRGSGPAVSPRTVLLILLSILLSGALACQVIWQHVRYNRSRVQLKTLEQNHHKLSMKVQRLESNISRLERLERIQRIAVHQLGLKPIKKIPVLEMSQVHWVQSSRKGDKPMIP